MVDVNRQQSILLVATAVSATVLGLGVAYGKWLYLGVFVAGIVVLWRPVEISLGLFALVIPFDSVSVLGGDSGGVKTLTWFIGAAATLVLIASGLVRGRLDPPPRATLWWLLFAGWGASSVLWAIEPSLVIERLPTLASLLLLYVVATSLRFTKKELSWVCAMSVLGACAAALYALYNVLHGHSSLTLGPRATIVLEGRETDPNVFGSALLLPTSIAIGAFLSFTRRSRMMAALVGAIICVLGIVLTMSRGALLSLLAIMAVFVFRTGIKNRRRLLIFCLPLPLVLLMPVTFFARLQEAVPSGGAGRFAIWIVGYAALKHYGLFGAGLENFPRAYQNFAGLTTEFRGYDRASHNIYLGFAVELGVIGLFFLLKAFATQLRDARRVSDSAPTAIKPILVGFEAACWSMLVSGFFLDMVWRKQFWFSWILLAVITRWVQRGEEISVE